MFHIVERYSLTAEHERSPPMMRYPHPRRANAYFVCMLVIILFTSQLAFIRFISKRMDNESLIFNYLVLFLNRTRSNGSS